MQLAAQTTERGKKEKMDSFVSRQANGGGLLLITAFGGFPPDKKSGTWQHASAAGQRLLLLLPSLSTLFVCPRESCLTCYTPDCSSGVRNPCPRLRRPGRPSRRRPARYAHTRVRTDHARKGRAKERPGGKIMASFIEGWLGG